MTDFAPAIAANISALARLLTDAAILAEESVEAMERGARNEAIGTIMPLEQSLSAATALLGSALTLHRQQSAADEGYHPHRPSPR